MSSDKRVGHLQELVHELASHGLVARVVQTRSGPVFLRVVNPKAASLSENVTCAPAPRHTPSETGSEAGSEAGPDGEDYYWWSWGERMHRVDDPGGAAVKVAHVLDVAGHDVPTHNVPAKDVPTKDVPF